MALLKESSESEIAIKNIFLRIRKEKKNIELEIFENVLLHFTISLI